jgi:Na+/H+ antiporter NhaC
MAENYGVLSLLPPLLAIVLAAKTRNVIIALFSGVLLGATMLQSWNPALGFVSSVSDYVLVQAGDDWNASVLILMIAVGGFVGLLERSGGALAFAGAMKELVTSRTRAYVVVWCSAFALFFSDSANPLIRGPLFAPVFDKLRISREKLAYLIDATASSVCVLVPITSWGAFVLTLIAAEMEGLGLADEPMAVLLRALPFQLYAITALVLVLLVGVLHLDFGPMKAAEIRVKTTGEVLPKGAKLLRADNPAMDSAMAANGRVRDMVLPVATLFGVLATMLLWRGGWPNEPFLEAIASGNSVVPAVCLAFLSAGLVSGLLLLTRGTPVDTCVDGWLKGASGMMPVLLVLVLAWSLSAVCKQLGTAAYVAGALGGVASPVVIPALVFLVGGVVSFATGSAWGCFAILLPIALPLAHAAGAPLHITVGAVLSGGLFGDHCSPISDTTILASLGSSCDHVQHVYTQLPYALAAASASVVGYLIAGATGSYVALGLSVALVLIASLAIVVTRWMASRQGSSQGEPSPATGPDARITLK